MTETDFQQVHHDFLRAVEAILDPATVTDIHGNEAEVPSLLDQIDDGMTQAGGVGMPSGGYASRPPIWTGGLDWLIDIKRIITDAASETHRAHTFHPTTDALSWLTWALDAPWAPAHTEALRHATTRLQDSRRTGMRLIYPQMFAVAAACPACHVATVDIGDTVGGKITSHVLSVHELWADCSACGTVWEGADIMMLAISLAANADDLDAADILQA